MRVEFKNPKFEYMIESILAFQQEEATPFWSEPLFHFYPMLDKEYVKTLSFEEKRIYITDTLQNEYSNAESMLEEKIALYSKHWEKHEKQITEALSEAFELDCSVIMNDMVCNISMNPIQPRFLKEHTFDVFYLNSERGAIGVSLHEIIHFLWFYVWNKCFNDTYEEYETPSLKWILSEMVVETIMKDERLSSINPYFPRENGGCIYPYFFDMKVDGRYVLDVIDEMYRSKNMEDFMKCSYEYCLAHEEEIRKHIFEAEG